MPNSTHFIGDSFWGQLQTAVEETSTWVASTWTTLGAAAVGDPENNLGQTPPRAKTNRAKRTVLSSRSMSFVPKGQVERTIEVEEVSDDNTSTTTQLPVKFTFIHFEDEQEKPKEDPPVGMVRQHSAPGVLCTVPFSEKLSRMERSHWKGTCRPCAYFHNKADSCRRGEDCEFCHICRPEELRRQKRAKKKAQREARENWQASWGYRSKKSRGSFAWKWSEGSASAVFFDPTPLGTPGPGQ